MDTSTLLIGLCAVVGIWIVIRTHRDKKFKISPTEAKKQLETSKDIILLDVRTQEEYREKHIPKSLLIPLKDLRAQASKRLPDKNREIFVYCRSGSRSAVAVRILSELGYEEVKDLGGIIHWPYEVVSGRK